ncbi:MAG TPA: hypothetical protein VEC99_11760, partial [Clostridia bacterium]|nr:hypothetical protein [Clostridia bacterium]
VSSMGWGRSGGGPPETVLAQPSTVGGIRFGENRPVCAKVSSHFSGAVRNLAGYGHFSAAWPP